MNWLLIVVCFILVVCAIDGYRKGLVHVLISLLSLIITIVLVGIATPYISDFLTNKTPLYDSLSKKIISVMESEDGNENTELVAEENQTEAINGFAFPDMVKKALIKNNNEEQYNVLEALNFQDYVAKYLSKTIIKIMSFFITFIIITIFLRMTFFTLDIIANLPVIKGVNKLAGLGVGLVQGVLIIWIAFFVVILFAGDDISIMLYSQIDANPFLKVLFDYNMILNYIMK